MKKLILTVALLVSLGVQAQSTTCGPYPPKLPGSGYWVCLCDQSMSVCQWVWVAK